jgi:hypothetical protein
MNVYDPGGIANHLTVFRCVMSDDGCTRAHRFD